MKLDHNNDGGGWRRSRMDLEPEGVGEGWRSMDGTEWRWSRMKMEEDGNGRGWWWTWDAVEEVARLRRMDLSTSPHLPPAEPLIVRSRLYC